VRTNRPLALLLAGLLVPTLLILGPALVGNRILLDVALLGQPGFYLPVDARRPWPPPHDRILVDAIYQFEQYRVYAARAVRSGRLPLWSGLNYCGSPFLAANQTAVFSPYRLLDYLWPSPRAIAWGQLAKILVAGLGACVYFRRAVGATPIAAVIGGCAYPWNGFLTLWSGHPHSAVATWLPWLLLAADATARGRRRFAGIGLAAATAAVLVSGHAATAAHVLIAGGLQGLFSAVDAHRTLGIGATLRAALRLGAGFALGVLLSGPQTLPTIEYMRESRRVHDRATGRIETPPRGWSALPQVVLPYFEGATSQGAVYVVPGNRPESAATAYPGLLLALVAAPMALAGGRRPWILFAASLVIVGLAQVLDLPLLARLLDTWPMSALRNNRLTLLSAFGLLLLAVLGLSALESRHRPSRRLAWAAAVPIALLGLLSLYRGLVPPDALDRLVSGPHPSFAPTSRAWFASVSYWGAGLSALAVGCWWALRRRSPDPSSAWMLGVVSLAELALSAASVFPLGDPRLYYPRLPVLEALARAPAGRICGVACLPPNLNQTHGLADVRGYDGADPDRLVDVLVQLDLARPPLSPYYARTMMLVPRVPSPLADMLGLRYLVFRGSPPPGVDPFLSARDYFVLLNASALPRAWVPRRVEVVADRAERLNRLADARFDPREVAYVESPVPLPSVAARGEARVMSDEEERLLLAVDMASEGMVVLSDRWESGWKAFLDGQERPVARVNHAFRGVVVPAGRRMLEFRYEPSGFRYGIYSLVVGLAGCVLWTLTGRRPLPGP
jgi:hypothetical protein